MNATASAIRPLAAVHLREALTAAADGHAPAALAALMHIDPESWQAIETRLSALGTTVLDALALAARTGGTE
ncbi:hypothetical protein GCM10010495_11470 [Kitasatospora herbaricolor]|uniref:hypothetical protein n=1 Tax=Kitasatospora herbaricolor TaxID=68217 RepID=UPI00174A7FBA|nr:hypothetical protein [Kitasatospora herbaricolor]MDQ0309416.1 hypothetical protein [Kitasatospora herbaricolor]GGV01950.1 hypothetical protein GCM10010495_11470 [Kitasatospora herbaricolor]